MIQSLIGGNCAEDIVFLAEDVIGIVQLGASETAR
jgi:hypothetical protein